MGLYPRVLIISHSGIPVTYEQSLRLMFPNVRSLGNTAGKPPLLDLRNKPFPPRKQLITLKPGFPPLGQEEAGQDLEGSKG